MTRNLGQIQELVTIEVLIQINDMLCEPIIPDSEQKDGNNLTGVFPVNIIFVTTNIDIFLLCQTFAQYHYLKTKTEEQRDQ